MHYPLPSDKRVHFYFKWPEHPDSIYTSKMYLQNAHAQVVYLHAINLSRTNQTNRLYGQLNLLAPELFF